MTNPISILDELWFQVPPDAQAAIAALFILMRQRNHDLEARVADLEGRLKLNSTNSHKPPSSDFIGAKRKSPALPTGKKRGGRPKHREAHRELVPPEKVRETFTCKPTDRRRCGHDLLGDDPTPLIHQVAELPRVEPIVDEYRRHRLACPDCGETTCGILPPGVPSGRFGPYSQAVSTVFAGAYRLSKRQIRQLSSDLFGLSISTGMISKLERRSAEVLEAPYNESAVSVHSAEAVNIDETSWRENREKAWLWTPATRIAAVFTIARHRSGEVAGALPGSEPEQVVGSDRFDGTLDWERFGQRMVRLRREVRQTLEHGSKCGCAKTSATCFKILKVEEGLWTFARVEGVEPTNNAAERALRFAVIRRRISGGTDSERGSRFVERTLSVVATCRQQSRNVLEYWTSCFEADHRGQPIPSLLPTSPPKTKAA